MRSVVKYILIVVLFAFSSNLLSQTTIPRFLVSVWPEYDHPGVLVIFNGDVNEDDLPVEMNFPIPENSRFALVVGTTDTTDRPVPIPIQDAAQGKQISFELIKPEFNVTFYYNPFQTDNPHRHYMYDFASNLSIDTLNVDLQIPLMAQGFEPEMTVDEQLQDSHGISYNRANFTNVAANDTIHIEAHYENPQGQLTSQLLQQQMGGQMPQGGGAAGGQSQQSNNTFWLIAVIIIILIGVLYFLVQGKGTKTPREETAAVPEQAEPGVIETESGEGKAKYCIHCGAKIPVDAKFCTSCGENQS